MLAVAFLNASFALKLLFWFLKIHLKSFSHIFNSHTFCSAATTCSSQVECSNVQRLIFLFKFLILFGLNFWFVISFFVFHLFLSILFYRQYIFHNLFNLLSKFFEFLLKLTFFFHSVSKCLIFRCYYRFTRKF